MFFPSVGLKYLLSVITLLDLSMRLNALYCFKCLNIDCPEDDPDCQEVWTYLQGELATLYNQPNDTFPRCPNINDTNDWTLLQAEDTPCLENEGSVATCTVGHMQIKTSVLDNEGSSIHNYFNYATVMGCANPGLRNLILQAELNYMPGCDSQERRQYVENAVDGVVVDVTRELQIRHCSNPESQCSENDYCVNFEKSVVQKRVTYGTDNAEYFSNRLVIIHKYVPITSILVIAAIVILVERRRKMKISRVVEP